MPTSPRLQGWRAVSFDAAGTLFHPTHPIGELYASVAARHGLQVDPAFLHTRFRAAFAGAPPLAFPGVAGEALRAHEKAWWLSVVRDVFAPLTFPAFEAYFEDLFRFFATTAAWRADPEARLVLQRLRAMGVEILVVSNFDARVRTVLDALDLGCGIDRVTISSEAGAAKPDPRIFATALAAARLPAHAVLHVGDTTREDLAGARAAGIPVVLVGNATLAASAPDATVLPRLRDVVEWLVAHPARPGHDFPA